MKTDYTITPEYTEAVQICQQEGMAALQAYAQLQNFKPTHEQIARMQRGMMNVNASCGQQMANSTEAAEWLNAYAEARRSHAAGEPLIRTVCKIAARILFVLLLVGVGVGVMLK